jgi:aminoglycoside phosphotransferase family enzyme/predicted kinase
MESARSAAEALEPLPALLPQALCDPQAFPEDPSARQGIELIQTHISCVFLSRERVYKLRKAVRPGFLDFGTRRERNADCLREVALNRRLASGVYLGVAPVHLEAPRARVGPPAEALSDEALEHCVVMRRLPAERDALSLLARGQLRPEHIDAISLRVARFHEQVRLGVPAPFSPAEWLRRISTPVEENLRLTGDPADPARPARIAAAAQDFLQVHAARFEARRQAGRAVDGHGDLHLAHIWFEHEGAEPLFIDCIEFSEALRRIDAASEVAFLAMDLEYRGQVALAERFLRHYARECDDFDLYGVLPYYLSYRAGVRAKVAALAASDPGIPEPQRRAARESASRHLELTERALAPRRPRPLVILSGIVGTGKSSVAHAIAEEVGGVVVSSDRLRKRLAGLSAADHSRAGDSEGLYSRAATERVYRGLLERAEPITCSGRTAVLDATFSSASQREAARSAARALGVPLYIAETRCDPGVVVQRLTERATRRDDPSDAGPEFYGHSAAGFEPVREGEADAHLVVHTDAPDWRAELARRLSGLDLRRS